nr:hypothetical protein [Halomarina sp. BCD28]
MEDVEDETVTVLQSNSVGQFRDEVLCLFRGERGVDDDAVGTCLRDAGGESVDQSRPEVVGRVLRAGLGEVVDYLVTHGFGEGGYLARLGGVRVRSLRDDGSMVC